MRSISVDGQGHYNPDRSEDLWGKAVRPNDGIGHLPGTVRITGLSLGRYEG